MLVSLDAIEESNYRLRYFKVSVHVEMIRNNFYFLRVTSCVCNFFIFEYRHIIHFDLSFKVYKEP